MWINWEPREKSSWATHLSYRYLLIYRYFCLIKPNTNCALIYVFMHIYIISILVHSVDLTLHIETCNIYCLQGHINVNMRSVAAMMKVVLPSMLEKQKGAIVNVSSIAASSDIPYLAIYAASKVCHFWVLMANYIPPFCVCFYACSNLFSPLWINCLPKFVLDPIL